MDENGANAGYPVMDDGGFRMRCGYVNLENPLYIAYHDEEWGRPLHDDHALFELLILECFQAGLSWECILNKRAAFREAYHGFDVETVAAFDDDDIDRLMGIAGIVRNRLKINASIGNARAFMKIQQESGSFDAYLWGFTSGGTLYEDYRYTTSSKLSDRISSDLKERGMKFVGTTIIYSYLQATGVINGHSESCYLHGTKTT